MPTILATAFNPLKVVLGHTASQQVVFVGPFGVGKTTALRAVSDIPVVNTDVASSEACADASLPDKTSTTTGFDYGEWRFVDGSRVALIGIPGQERFKVMWDVMLPRSSAIVLWLYGNEQGKMAECTKWLEALAERKAIARLAVALTRVPDGQAECVLAPYRELISRYHPLAPVIVADPRSKSEVLQVITMALSSPCAVIERL